jgi:hypothetical protein
MKTENITPKPLSIVEMHNVKGGSDRVTVTDITTNSNTGLNDKTI